MDKITLWLGELHYARISQIQIDEYRESIYSFSDEYIELVFNYIYCFK